MGSFIYDKTANAFEVDDRTLAHVRIVVMNKLRRSEPFMFELTMRDGSGHRSFWIHQGVPLQFRIFSTAQVRINRLWIETLMDAASGPNGLFLAPEPDEFEGLPGVASHTAHSQLSMVPPPGHGEDTRAEDASS